MPAPISVVIPTLESAQDLPETLAALVEGIVAGAVRELVISDGGSTDATLVMAEEAGANLVSGPPGRGGQLRRGTEAAAGEWLLLLHSDTRLEAGWADLALRHIRNAPDRAAVFKLAFRAEGAMPRLVAGWANLRTRAFWLPYGDQGLLVRRTVLESVGGIPDLPLMEDVALARALRGRLAVLPVKALSSAERYLRDGWLRRGAGNLFTLLRYLCGTDPARLAARYARTR